MLSTGLFLRPSPRRCSIVAAAAALCAAPLAPHLAAAQGPTVAAGTVAHPPNTQEFGIDAGAVFGLGNQSSVTINLPAARARIGFFLNADSRISIEPAGSLVYSKTTGTSGKFVYDVELGALYHFRPPADVYSGPRATVAYVRPFIGVNGSSGGGSDNEFSAGAGLGFKVPWRTDIAFRFEGNVGYGFSNKAARLGAFAGLSFFTRNLIPTG